jgi:hypothetical protein
MLQLAQVRNFNPGTEVVNEIATFQGLEAVFNNVISVALGLAGVVFFIMLLLAGFKYLTAGGEPQKIESAQKTITWGIAGLVLVALAFLILHFIQIITGANVTQFKIFQP